MCIVQTNFDTVDSQPWPPWSRINQPLYKDGNCRKLSIRAKCVDWQPIQTKNTICGREEVESCLFDCNSNLKKKRSLFYFIFSSYSCFWLEVQAVEVSQYCILYCENFWTGCFRLHYKRIFWQNSVLNILTESSHRGKLLFFKKLRSLVFIVLLLCFPQVVPFLM